MVRRWVPEGLDDARVLAAMARVPRHAFVDPDQQDDAYRDRALSIGLGQTISQPFMVAFATRALGLEGRERVLEVGAGCGYQAAVLAECAREVVAIERIPELAERARRTLAQLGYGNVVVLTGDGSKGLAEAAPFDAILVSAAAARVPADLLDQLAPGGRLVAPVGEDDQHLVLFERTPAGVRTRNLLAVQYVPLIEEPRASRLRDAP